MHPLTNRKPARARADIPHEVLKALSQGEIETGNLVEGLALDFKVLLKTAFPDIVETETVGLDVPYTQRLKRSAELVWSQFGDPGLNQCLQHRSDTLRGIAAYVIPMMGTHSASEVLNLVRPLAADPHFGVREWAWLGIRPLIVAAPDAFIEALKPWVYVDCPNTRRFATEATRPRGVWCAHIHELRKNPERALDLLEPLKADPEKYVQDSVANWLNDASKTRPEWVLGLTTRWTAESSTPSTKRIVARALRTLNSA